MHGQTWSEHFKHVLDGLSIFTAVGALVDMLPEVAALFTIIWTGMRIVEMIAGKSFSEVIRRKKDNAEQQ